MKKILHCLLSVCLLMGLAPVVLAEDDGGLHNWGEWIVDVEPTCTTVGSQHRECTTCGEAEAAVEIPALGHQPSKVYDKSDEKVEPTCTEAGHEKWEHCLNCGALIIEKEIECAKTWVVVDKDTFVADGGYKIPALGHKWEEFPATEATCTEPAYSAYVKCTRGCCAGSDVYEEGHEKAETAPANGHQPVPAGDFTAPRCDAQEPLSVPAKCAVCGETLAEEIVIPVPDHSWKTVEAKAATCTEDWWDGYEQCEVCGLIKTADGQIPVTKALGHDFSVWVGAIAGDCTHDSRLAGFKCSRCDELEPGLALPCPGHKPEVIPAVPATCDATGLTEGKKCSVCDEILEAQQETPALEHKNADGSSAWKTILGKKATCTEDGEGAHRECALCGKIEWPEEEARVIPKLNHSNVDGYWPENYTDNTGKVHEGGDTEKRVVAELIPAGTAWNDAANEGITYYIDAEDAKKAKPATCLEDGYQPAKLCLFSGEVLEESKVLPALGHDWTLETAGVEPTCTELGVSDKYQCRRCALAVGGDPINARGHELELVEGALPTCTDDGHFAYHKCTRKGCAYAVAEKQEMVEPKLAGTSLDDQKVVAALAEKTEAAMNGAAHPAEFVIPKYDHKYVENVRPLEPNCTENGIKEGATRCLICEKYFNLEVLPALGHSVRKVEGHAADCLQEGLKDYAFCERCAKAADINDGMSDQDIQNALTASEITMPQEGVPESFIVPALGHEAAEGTAKEPTCTEAGHTAGTYCGRCGITLVEEKELPATGHSNVDGYDKAGNPRKIEIAEGTAWDTYPANEGVTYSVVEAEKAKAKDPTCTAEGYDPAKVCTCCGAELEPGEVLAPLGHTAGPVQEPILPTCTEYGYHGGIHCTVCKNELSQEATLQYLKEKNYKALEADGWIVIPELDAFGHKPKKVEGYDPTCENDGLKPYVYCTVCNKVVPETAADLQNELTASAVVKPAGGNPEEYILKALGHDWLDVPGGETTAPTCEKAGTDGIHQCKRCGKTEAKVLPALGHDMVSVEAKDVTCVENGNAAYSRCSRCDLVLDADGNQTTLEAVTIPATGDHTPFLVHVDALKPTCKDKGHTDGQECSVCGYHTWTEIPVDADAYHAFLETEKELANIGWTIEKEEDGSLGSGMHAKLCPLCGYKLLAQACPPVEGGDVNMDGKISSEDAMLILQYYIGVLNSLPNEKAADFNNDGEITPKDAQGILNYSVGN